MAEKTKHELTGRIKLLEKRISELTASEAKCERAGNEVRHITDLYVTLSQANQAIFRAGNADELFREITMVCADCGHFDLAWVSLLQETDGWCRVIAASGPAIGYMEGLRVSTDPARPEGQGPTGTSIREGKAVIVNDWTESKNSDPWNKKRKTFGICSSASFPLKKKNLVAGSLNLYSKEKDFFTKERVTLLECLVNDIEYALVKYDSEATRKRVEEVLREREEKYKRLIETTRTGYVILDAHGSVIDANPEYVRLTGNDRLDDIRGRSVFEWTAPYDLKRNEKEVIKCLEKGFVRDLEIDYIKPDGQVVPVEINATVMDAAGAVQVLTLCRDISGRRIIENNLRLSEEKFRKAFSTSPDSININRLEDGMYVSINDGFTKMTGYKETDCIGKTSLKLNIWADLKDRERLVAGLKETGYFENLEARFRAKNGSIIYGLMSASLIELNGVPHLLNITRDITERKRAENALALSEAEWRATFDAMNDSICLLDRDGKILRHNKATESFLSKSGKELDGQICHTVVHDISYPFENCPYQRMKESKQRESMTFHWNDKWLEVIVDPIFDKDRVLIGAVHIMHDITARKQTEEALKKSETMLKGVVSSVHIGLGVSSNRVIEWTNDYILSLLGRTKEELIGKSTRVFYDTEERFAEVGKSFYDDLELKGSAEIETCWVHKDGRVLNIDLIGVVLDGDDSSSKIIFSSGIIGNISMLRVSIAADDKNIEIIEEAEKSAQRAKNLTLQLLTFAKGGAPVKKITHIKEIVREAAVFAAHGSKAKCEFNIPQYIYLADVDPGQIWQVISNIVINAVQAMPLGGKIFVKAENYFLSEQASLPLKAGPYIRIVISDTGPGIPAKNLNKVFDPYFTTKETGSGLGLATSFSIIKNHGGYITAESDPGKGASFIILLPAVEGKVDDAVWPKEPGLKKGAGRILVLDDEEIIRVLAVRILGKLGYTVETFAESGKAVFRYAQTWGTAEAFDAVILDLTIPGEDDGKAVLAKLKAVNPAIKAVVSSGYSENPIVANFKEHGFSAALPKPYSIEEAGAVLSKLLTAK